MTARLRRLLATVVFGPGRRLWRLLPQSVRYSIGPRLAPIRRRLQGGKAATTTARQTRNAHAWVPIPAAEGSLPAPRLRSPRGTRPVVSIVVPAHNDEPYLDACVRSVVEQGYQDWELIVVDDCSLDRGRDVVAAHAERDDRIIIIRHERNLGLASTRNTGLAVASGTYVTFLDADDFIFQDSLARRVDAAEQSEDPTVVGSWCDWVAVPEGAGLTFTPPAGEKRGVIDYRSGRGRNQLISTSPLLRLDLVRSLGGFDATFRTAEDFEFLTRLFRNGFRLVGTGEVGVAYRQKRTSMVNADPLGHARNAAAVHAYMTRPMVDGAVADLATEPERTVIDGFPEPTAIGERLLTFLTFAMLLGSEEQIVGVESMLSPDMLDGVDVGDIIHRAVARHSMRVAGLDEAARAEVAERVRTRLAALDGGAATLPTHEGVIDRSRVEASHNRFDDHGVAVRVRAPRRPPTHAPWDVVLHAGSIEAARDLVVLGRELVEQGRSVALLGEQMGDEARQLALAEGIRVVGAPAGPARVQISSDGVDREIDATSHIMLCSEPWFVEPETEPDLVIARGAWEAERLARPGRPVESGGWVTRASRFKALGARLDGDVNRDPGDTVILLRAPGDRMGPGFAPVRAALGDDADLVAGPLCRAPADFALPASSVSVRVPSARAVITTGPGIPMDAVLAGVPVVSAGDHDLPRLAEALENVERGPVLIGDDDWTARHLTLVGAFLP